MTTGKSLIPSYREERLARFRRCCRFRSFHLAFWLLLSFARDAAPATGEVVSYHEIRDGGQVRQTPRVRFRTGTGEIVTIDGQLATSSRRYAIGAQVPMLYKVSQPTTARVATFTDNWLGACVAAVVGAVGMCGGLLVRRQVKRELKKMPA